jgi:predicted acylesterase/phospholipase RssA
MNENILDEINLDIGEPICDIESLDGPGLETRSVSGPETENLSKSKIKHLVLSGGGSFGLICYGILKESNLSGLWNLQDIQTIYGTSIGSICGLFIALNYEWDLLDNYIINRPWHNLFKFDISSILHSFQNNGIFDIKIIESIFSPLFKAKDIPLDATMKQLYEITNIELHFFSTELNGLNIVDISHKTHPDWKVIDSIYHSCSLPILFSPLSKEDKIYFDGGVLCNYPLHYCIENGAKIEEILAIKKMVVFKHQEENNLFEYLFKLMDSVFRKINQDRENIVIPNEIRVEQPNITLYNIYSVASDVSERTRLIELGKDAFRNFAKTS